MKPYIAILIDSFWEAVGNRVLWALLLGWSVVLLGLAPFGYITERSYRLSSSDIDNRGQLISRLAKGTRGEGRAAIVAVAKLLDKSFAQRLRQASDSDDSQGRRPITSSELAEQLNQILPSTELYDPAAFPTAKKRERLEPLIELVEASSLSPDQAEELNRELLQQAFPLELANPRGEQLWIGYAGFKIGDPLPISRRQIKQFFEPVLLAGIIKFGLGILAVFVAIVVTSPMIPDTFRSGSLHLLLSKPISRVWLYLAKFFGGCIFVLVNITFVMIGLYFIAGLRFEIWNMGLLVCIPILMFVFIIFYSVSALVGLIWGNAIVCVVACMLFWLACFSLGVMHDAIGPQVEVLPQISRIRTIDDRLLTVDQRGKLGVWNEQFSIWQPAIDDDQRGQARTFGPIYNAKRQIILTKSFFRDPFGGLHARNRRLAIIRLGDKAEQETVTGLELGENQNAEIEVDIEVESKTEEPDPDSTPLPDPIADPIADKTEDKTEDGPSSISQARETPVWLADSGPELPQELFDVVSLGDTVIAVCRGGLFRLDFNKLDLVEATQKGLFGIKLPLTALSAFDNVAPPDYFLGGNTRAAATQAGDGLIVFNSGTLDHLAFDGSLFSIATSRKLDGDGTEATLTAMNEQYCVVARDGKPLLILDSQLQPLSELQLPGAQQVRQLSWIPGSRDLSILTHTGHCWRLDASSIHTHPKVSPLAEPLSGNITTMMWENGNELWLGLKPDRVVRFDVARGRVIADYTPRATTLEKIYRWIIKPAYTINPKPAALDTAMSYALTGNKTQSLNLVTVDLEAAQMEVDLWTPILTNSLFVIVVLGFSCWYVARKEF